MNIHILLPFAADVLLRVTLVLGAFAAAGYLLRNQTAALRHLVWSLAVAGCVAVPAISVVNPFTLAVLPARAAQAAPAPDLQRIDRFASADLIATNARAEAAVRQEPRTLADVAESAPPAQQLPWASVFLFAWTLGSLVFITRYLAGLAAIRRVVAAAVPASASWTAQLAAIARGFGVRRQPRLVLSSDTEMPFAFGVTRPVIVLPAAATDWTGERRAAVLMHELAHFSRGDIPMNALSQLARALYWFHPLAWLAAHRLRVEGERASDDVVLRGGALPSAYAEHLLAIVRSFGRALPAPAVAMARRSDFEGRLLAILEPRERGALSRARAFGVAALAVAVLLPLSAVSRTARAAAAPTATTSAVFNPLPQGGQPAPPAPARAATAPPRDVPPAMPRDVRAPSDRQSAQAPAQSTIDALAGTLGDANTEVRLAAVKSLGSLQDPRAIAALAKALKEDSDPRVREAAAWALGEIDDARGVVPLLEALKTERVASVREQIVHALGEIDDPTAVSGVAAASKDASAEVRREVAHALGELGDPAASGTLAAMSKDDDVEVRRNVAEALDELKGDGAYDALILLARDADAEVRSNAVNALGNLEDRRALPTLVQALKDANADVRQHAADAIDDIPDIKTAPPALIDALADQNADVRQNAANSLGNIGDDAAVPALKKATGDSNSDVRRSAAEALSDIGGEEAITALLGLLKDPDPEIRKIAAEALGKRHE